MAIFNALSGFKTYIAATGLAAWPSTTSRMG